MYNYPVYSVFCVASFFGIERASLMVFSQRIFCGQLTADDIGREVHLAGWVDTYATTAACSSFTFGTAAASSRLSSIRNVPPRLYCRKADFPSRRILRFGQGQGSPASGRNGEPHIKTGDIEVMAGELAVLSESDALPFAVRIRKALSQPRVTPLPRISASSTATSISAGPRCGIT